jgi:heavy metal translocating P-type ATPase
MRSRVIDDKEDISLKRQILLDESLIGLLLIVLIFSITNIFPKDAIKIVSIIVSFFSALPVAFSAVRALVRRKITIDLLASIALVFTFIEGQWISATFINLMLASARLFDSFTEEHTRKIIEKLLAFRPSFAKRRTNGIVEEIALEDVRVGDEIIVDAGDRVPIDGKIISGFASVNQSTLTGESMPVEKVVGDMVLSSTLNESGSLVVRADSVGENTALAKIIALTDEASREKTSIEKIGDRFAGWYISLTLISTILIYLVTHNTMLVLGILLVTCADDIAVSVPLAFTVAISIGARHGIILKGASVIERLRGITTVITDKTGTLTTGKIAIQNITLSSGVNEDKAYTALNACSTTSNHPVSRAIQTFLREKNIPRIANDEFQELSGAGIVSKYKGITYRLGRPSYLEQNSVVFPKEIIEKINEFEKNGFSITCVSQDGEFLALISFQDTLRDSAKDAITQTKILGIKKWIMLTGDNEHVAQNVSKKVGIDEFHAGLRPEDKLSFLKSLKAKGKKIMMIGDGVNDAASLALADVGVAMGKTGAEASIEASDITLVRDNLIQIPHAMLLSKRTFGVVRNNFIIWAVTNALGLILVLSGVIGPVGASFYNFITDFIPVLNVFSLFFLERKFASKHI